jgi:IS1 family transposase
VSRDEDKNDAFHCRKLLDEVINDCKDGDTAKYDNLVRRDKGDGENRNKIGIIATDGNWSYHKEIKCKKRKIVKVKKEKVKDASGKETNRERIIKINRTSKEVIKFLEHQRDETEEERQRITEENKKIEESSTPLREIEHMEYDIRKEDESSLHCDEHIVDKAETCLVESWNASLRGRFARFVRETKAFSRSLQSVCNAVLMWVNRDLLMKNRRRYASYCYEG